MNHRPRRRFSQNFLVDAAMIAAIVAALRPRQDEHIVEIGPGLGALTRPLLMATEHVHAIEVDRDLAALLEKEFGARLKLHVSDVLKFDFSSLGNDLRVIGNLPYHISTPVLFHVAQFCDQIRDIHVMLQKEVVARMTAAPSDSNYSRLSVMLQYRFSVEKLIDVPATAFNPAPAVESAVARLIPLRPMPHIANDEDAFARVVAAAFSQRRKTLRNSLREYVSERDFDKLSIAPEMRAQNLGVEHYVAIANHIVNRDS